LQQIQKHSAVIHPLSDFPSPHNSGITATIHVGIRLQLIIIIGEVNSLAAFLVINVVILFFVTVDEVVYRFFAFLYQNSVLL